METSPAAPVPQIDPEPDPGNEVGGTDAVAEDPAVPPVTPDVPMSAQLDDDDIPDAIQQPETPDTEANTADPSAESSA